MRVKLWVAVGLAAMWVGCGGGKPPTYQLTQSKAAVRGAQEVRAGETPQAALHLKMAKDNLRLAEELILERNYSAAKHLLIRAEADANLAIALANEAEAKDAAEDAKKKLEKLRRDTQ